MNPIEDREPRSLTMLDLVALVLGFALAYHFDYWPLISLLNRPPAGEPIRYFLPERIDSLTRMFALAMMPVILARRLRYGGLPRPGEWLAILLGWSNVVLRHLPSVLLLISATVNHTGGTSRWTPLGVYIAAVLIPLAIILAGLSLVIAARKRLPDIVKTVALIVLALAVKWGPLASWNWACAYGISPWIRSRIGGSSFAWDHVLFNAIGWLPDHIYSGLFIGWAILSVRRTSRRPLWTEWVGLGACALSAFSLLGRLVPDAKVPFRQEVIEAPLSLSATLVSVAVGILVARWIGPAWNRRLGLGYDEGRTGSPASEA